MKNFLLPLTLLISLSSASAFAGNDDVKVLKAKINQLEEKVAMYEAEKTLEAANVARYDKMDLVAFTNHDLDMIGDLHAADVKVINPDGSLTSGWEHNHKAEMEWLFSTYSDVKITEHPIKFGSGDWTAGMSVIKGTWDTPMPLIDGRVLKPTGKAFSTHIVTLVRWEDGQIAEEYLMWDNMDWYGQIGALEAIIGK
ncbi:ester cyclase [Vibrio sp. SNU_ST1]|uniref:ester cyclase n=1 Tax=Vibrio sp. SNU_ST1 TaxID=3064001 RepID=UPI00272CAA1F|nr:ester cyclase [Vibrio sp. SNU_ST1]WKY58631.1 ester cyclase [Vibrio sp. SNU_ST1]